MAGFGAGIASGVVTASFVESPLSITVTNSTLITNTEEFQDTIAATGSLMITAEAPNVLDTFTINADGSLTLLQSTTDSQANGEINFDIFSRTRKTQDTDNGKGAPDLRSAFCIPEKEPAFPFTGSVAGAGVRSARRTSRFRSRRLLSYGRRN